MNAYAAQANQHYQRMQVESASPEKLLLLLYDGAIKKLNQAESALIDEDFVTYHTQVTKVQRIISELLNSLDCDQGGDVAVNLVRLYDYMLRQLSIGMIRRQGDLLSEVRLLLEDLRGGWQEAIQQIYDERSDQPETSALPRETVRTGTYGSAASCPTGADARPSLNIAG